MANKFYKFGVETYSGKKTTVTVSAETEEDAVEKLSSYKVSHGELHYRWLIEVSDSGEEQYYKPDDDGNVSVAVALAGVLLGRQQRLMGGGKVDSVDNELSSAIKNEETMRLLV